MESERPDALFHDPYARRLAGERGERILASMKQGRTWAWPMIVRTAVMDELILRGIARDRVDTVVNLAAGLDTRPYRLSLAPSLRWVEVDFPDVIAYKQQQLAGERPACALEQIGADLTDAAPQADDAPGLAVEPARPAVPQEEARGVPTLLRNRIVGATVGATGYTSSRDSATRAASASATTDSRRR